MVESGSDIPFLVSIRCVVKALKLPLLNINTMILRSYADQKTCFIHSDGQNCLRPCTPDG